jgi:hypothetical protein
MHRSDNSLRIGQARCLLGRMLLLECWSTGVMGKPQTLWFLHLNQYSITPILHCSWLHHSITPILFLHYSNENAWHRIPTKTLNEAGIENVAIRLNQLFLKINFQYWTFRSRSVHGFIKPLLFKHHPENFNEGQVFTCSFGHKIWLD